MYLDHDECITNFYWNDVIMLQIADLPKFLSTTINVHNSKKGRPITISYFMTSEDHNVEEVDPNQKEKEMTM
jgi:hypothetical protein